MTLQRRLRAALLAAALLAAQAREICPETLTLSTTYPSPAGVYNTILTTGSSPNAAANNTNLNILGGNTLLVQNAGNSGGWVGIGTPDATADSRGSKLNVGGNADMGGNQVMNIALTPLNPSDAASKAYVDAKSSGPGSWTCAQRSATTTGINALTTSVQCHSGEQVINGGCASSATASPPLWITNAPTTAGPGWQCVASSGSASFNLIAIATCCQ